MCVQACERTAAVSLASLLSLPPPMDLSWDEVDARPPSTPLKLERGGRTFTPEKLPAPASAARASVVTSKASAAARSKVAVASRASAARRIILTKAKFDQLSDKWAVDLVIDRQSQKLGSWLQWQARHPIERSGAGCLICYKMLKKGTWARCRVRTTTALQVCHALRHAKSKGHIDAVNKFLCRDSGDHVAAPSQADFKAVLDDRKRSAPTSLGNDQVGRKMKIARMNWCLAEAVRDLDREAFKEATTVLLKQDERAGFALQRFTCSNERMERRCGITSACRPDTGSAAIRDAVYANLKAACTSRVDPPAKTRPDAPGPRLDSALLQRLCSKVEFYCPDGAADEQRAGRLLQGDDESTSPAPPSQA